MAIFLMNEENNMPAGNKPQNRAQFILLILIYLYKQKQSHRYKTCEDHDLPQDMYNKSTRDRLRKQEKDVS